MISSKPLWSIVLAAGDGARLASVTRKESGEVVPKQFWSFEGVDTMLDWTLQRIAPLVTHERTVVVVAERHRRWWTDALPARATALVQPENRGTAAGLLLPLLRVAMQDPQAIVLVTPSDHFVEDPEPLRHTIRWAQGAVEMDPDAILLLGVTPESADPEYGWILPNMPGKGEPARKLAAFVEKPPRDVAMRLYHAGALWNSFMMVGRARAFLETIRDTQAALYEEFLAGVEAGIFESPTRLAELYRRLPILDFSRDVLEPAGDRLGLLQVPSCGWTDLGTVGRVARWRTERAARRHEAGAPRAARGSGALGLGRSSVQLVGATTAVVG